MKMSGGEALVKSLVHEGVEVVFGIPGIQMYGISAALRDEPGIRMITTRHEQASTYMADGYARASGKPGVALVVPGVGLYNAAAGLATAYSRSSPVLLIAGQIPRRQIGKNLGGVHEVMDQADVIAPVTKWRDGPAKPRLCGLCGVFLRCWHEGQRSFGTGDAHSGGIGAPGASDHRCTNRTRSAASGQVDRPCLVFTVDETSGRVDYSLTGVLVWARGCWSCRRRRGRRCR